jgi:hypothetical protein
MVKKLGNLLCSLIPSIRSIRARDMISKNHKEDFEIEVDWEDISRGVPNSRQGSVITHAMKRHGLYGYATECLLVLEDGTVYIPRQLSDHWECYLNSPKLKPKSITYFSEEMM